MANKVGVETILKLWASWKDWMNEDCTNNKTITAIKSLLRKNFAEELHLTDGSKEFNVSWCFSRVYRLNEMVQDVPEKISKTLDHLREISNQVFALMPEAFAPTKETPLELLNLSVKALEEETQIEYSSLGKGFQLHKVWRGAEVSLSGQAVISQGLVERIISVRQVVVLPRIVMSHQAGRAVANYEDSFGSVQFWVDRYVYSPDRGEFNITEITQWSERFPTILRDLQRKQVMPLYSHAVSLPPKGEEELSLM